MRGSGVLVIVMAATVGCSGPPRRVAMSPAATLQPQAIVFTADGAGNYQGLSNSLKDVVMEDHLPLHVHTFEWSHGYRRIIADHVDAAHAREEGKRLAEEILCYHRQGPESALPISIVAHSAGSQVALVAAEYLPPDSLDHIILLAPSVSANYDIRPALRCARQGVDVFYSRADRAYLGFGVAVLGTSDGSRSPVSGRVGFSVPDNSAAPDASLYVRLRQHPWEESLRWTGHNGGHFTVREGGYLRAVVVPLLLPGR
jgi:hypothetical protein